MKSTSSAAPPAPRYAIGWALVTYVLCTLILGYPALTGGFLVSPISDQWIGGFPVRDFAAQSLKAGEGIPHWNPYIMGGLPYIAAMHGDIFYPTFLLRALLPTDVAMTWSFMIHMVLAGLFTYVFLRACGLSFWGALIGGAAYMMSGPIASYVSPGHDGKLYVSALLPLLLFFLIRGIRDGRLWAWGGIAITTGLGVLSPHPQLLQYMLLAAGAFGLYLALGTWNAASLPRGPAVTRLGFALGAVVLGFLMGAIQYAPVIGYIDWSPRAGGAGWEHAISYSFPTSELFNMYLPEFTGILDKYWGANGIHFHSEYLGPGILILATAAFGAVGAAQAMSRSFRLFWLGVLIVSLLWALGGYTPFYRIIYAIVPGTKFFRAPSTMIYVTAFAVAVFAAIGAERVLSQRWWSKKHAAAWMGFATLVVLLALTGGLTNLGVTLTGGAMLSETIPLSEMVYANASAVSLGSLRAFVFVALMIGALWAVANGKLPGRGAGLLLLLVVVADLWTVERRYWQFSPPARQVYASDPTIEYLRAHADSGRVLTLPVGAARRDAMLSGDGLMVHQVRQAIGYHGNELGRFRRLTCGGQDCGGASFVGPLQSANIRALLNVRYLAATMPPNQATIQQLVGPDALVAGPVRNARGSMVYLYRFPGANPPAWVASGALPADDQASLATLLDPRFNEETLRRVALVDTSSAMPRLAGPEAVPAASPIMASVERPTHSSIVVRLSQPAQQGNVLVVSENFYPGWRAEIDGREALTERVNYVLTGIALPAGAREVRLTFRDPNYQLGKTITFVALALALAAAIAGMVLDRRRRVPVAA